MFYIESEYFEGKFRRVSDHLEEFSKGKIQNSLILFYSKDQNNPYLNFFHIN